MPVMSQKTATYTYELAELTKLIAKDLNVPIEEVDVRFNLHRIGDDLDSSSSFSGSDVTVRTLFLSKFTPTSYSVRDVTVTVDMKKTDEFQSWPGLAE